MADVPSLLAGLALILMAAKVGGHLATRLSQPAVLGELVAGVAMGNLGLAGVHGLEALGHHPGLETLSELGVIVLLFEVGLESTIGGMMKVGLASLLVACLGVVAPFALGYLAGKALLPDASTQVCVFLGAALTATSVGITARVLRDLGRAGSVEGQIILGAAVIDDVLGLVILAAVGGIIEAQGSGQGTSLVGIAVVSGKALGFLVGALVLGVWLSPRMFRIASRLEAAHVLLAVGLSFCFLLAYLAALLGLAPIVGAFAAGLVLESTHYESLTAKGEHDLTEAIQPISSFLVPVFFVLMGMRVDLRSFADPHVLLVAGALCVAAIVGKQACAAGVVGVPGADRLSVGIGMIPRGEVGLIFASIGQKLQLGGQPVVTPALYSALVIMVITTTLITPPALKWSLGRRPRRTV